MASGATTELQDTPPLYDPTYARTTQNLAEPLQVNVLYGSGTLAYGYGLFLLQTSFYVYHWCVIPHKSIKHKHILLRGIQILPADVSEPQLGVQSIEEIKQLFFWKVQVQRLRQTEK